VHWTAKGDVVTLGAVVDEKLLDGQPTDPAKPAKRRAEIERSRRLETHWLALIAGKTFTPDELRIEARTLVVTLAGTRATSRTIASTRASRSRRSRSAAATCASAPRSRRSASRTSTPRAART